MGSKNLSILLCMFLAAACGGAETDDPCKGSGGGGRTITGFPTTHPNTEKVRPLFCSVEVTPFVWNDQVLAVTSTGGSKATGFFIYDLFSAKPLSMVDAGGDFNFVSAIVADGTLYVYGTTGNSGIAKTQPDNSVVVVKTTDLVNWSKPTVVYRAASNIAVHNTSVTHTPSGFVMALEILQEPIPGTPDPRYSVIFARGTTPELFTDEGGTFSPAPLFYAACPSIRFVDGYYYVLYTSRPEPYLMVFVARSRDLINWEVQTSGFAALSPVNGADFEYDNGKEAINNSDADIVEHEGITYLVYNYGNQGTISYIALAKFNGTMRDYFVSFF